MKAPTGLIKIKGRYYAQVRVPLDIVESYGRKQHKESLKTGDYTEACRQLHAKVAEIKGDFEDHRAKLKAVTTTVPAPPPSPQSFADLGRQHGRDIAEQALTIRADLYEAAVANPKEFWRDGSRHFSSPTDFTYFDKLAADGDLDRIVGYIVRTKTDERIADLRRMIDTGDMGEQLALAEERSPGLDRKAHVALALTLTRAEIVALQGSLSSAFPGDVNAHVAGRQEASAPIPVSSTPVLAPVSLDALFDKWKAEGRQKSASTLSTWRGIIKSLKATFPGKADDAGSLTPEDMIKWKDHLNAVGLTAKTINAGYLACARTLFNYGVSNRLIASNPGIGVKVSTGKRGLNGPKTRFGYTNADVGKLLALAKKETSPALRWLPWLAAQTGSRIGEVAQLWGSFVKKDEGIWYLDIQPAPDAGTIKEDVSARKVPIHQQLIEDGFVDFVKSKGDGPLFYKKSSGDPEKKHASKGVSNRVAAWVRKNGFTDKRIDPNHGLRHWFKTHASSTAVGLEDRMVDTLQGHAHATEAGGYFEPELSEKLEALNRIKLPPVPAYAGKDDDGASN